MAYYSFNQDIDKITERELVYDIVERLTLGKDLSEGHNKIWNKGTFITEMWKKLVYMLPPTITLNFLKVKVGVIHIAAGAKTGTTTISDLDNGIVLLALSQQNGNDIKECLATSVNSGALTCTLTTDLPFTKDEYIKVYAY